MRVLPVFIFSLGFIFPSGICSKSCHLPSSWLGSWFESGYGFPIEITTTTLAHKGECRQKGKGEGQVIFKDSVQGTSCLRCLYIHQKHPNIIQYKESHCISESVSPVTKICRTIEVDDPLKTLFRLSASPVPCPISGSHSFSYQLGPGRNCSSPLSSITECKNKDSFMMRYQACPDMQGSQSMTEQVECIAQWKEGSIRYFAARVNSSIISRSREWENMFRCFVYRTQYNGWLLAQSGEAACNLHKATEGYRTMSLVTAPRHSANTSSCQFPSWLPSGQLLQNIPLNLSVVVDAASLTIAITRAGQDDTLLCAALMAQAQHSLHAVFRVQRGCDHFYQCGRVRKMTEDVLAIRMGRQARHQGDACQQELEKEVLIRPAASLSPCPLSGVFPPGSCSPLALATVNTATTNTHNLILTVVATIIIRMWS